MLTGGREWIKERPSAVQAELLHLYVWGPTICTPLAGMSGMSDEELLEWTRYKIANTSTTMGAGSGDTTTGRAWSEPEIGFGILDGKLSTDEVEEWVRTADTSILTSNGIEYRGP